MLVVGMALGWFVREKQIRGEANDKIAQAMKWRTCTGALECALKEDGWQVDWHLESSTVGLAWPAEGASASRSYAFRIRYLPTDSLEPSVDRQ
jgi:hypothetical protein